MLRNDQIDKISELFLDLAKGLFLAAFAIQIFTGSDIIMLGKYIVSAISSAIFGTYVLTLKGNRK